ncbi:MAG: hypothetical protein AB7Q01_02575 [Gammaproteobacteria bacterium]|nr:hypothetical protein [Burkholderiaceae bacterium]
MTAFASGAFERLAAVAPTSGALAWLLVLCMIDAPAPVLAPLLVAGIGLAVALAMTRHGAGWASRRLLVRKLPLPLALFAAVILINVALQEFLVDAISRPYFVNLLTLHILLLAWAWIATPRSAAAWREVHLWSWRLLALLTAIVILQAMVRELLGTYLDVRLWITGVPSRSGVEEGTEGLRPTSMFAEPSNHAIITFLLALVNRLTGTDPAAQSRSSAVAVVSCLVSASGIGLLLAAVLTVELVVRLIAHALRRGAAGPVALGVLWTGSALLAWSPQALEPQALQRIVEPSTGYDPLAVRAFVPARIWRFEPDEHLLGTGIANYASLEQGLTLYDSSFALGAYYQAGVAAVAMLAWLVLAATRRHSWAAATLVMALLATKMSLIAPMFWGLCMLLDRGSRCPSLGRA